MPLKGSILSTRAALWFAATEMVWRIAWTPDAVSGARLLMLGTNSLTAGMSGSASERGHRQCAQPAGPDELF
jgi:hypothetical protein